jgi:plasmid stabilization system protein ParE
MRGSLRLATPHRIECAANDGDALRASFARLGSHKGRGRSDEHRGPLDRLEQDAGSIEAVIAMEDRNQVLCSRSEEFSEGIRAFLEKRKPVYIKR